MYGAPAAPGAVDSEVALADSESRIAEAAHVLDSAATKTPRG